MINEQMEDLLTQAVALRVTGASWKTVAAAVGRDVNTVKHWPERFPSDWLRLRLIAQRQLLGDAYGEALTSLRMLMRSQNEKAVQAASATVVRTQLEHDKLEARQSRVVTASPKGAKPAQLSTEGQQIAGILDGMSMEQMQQMCIRVGQAIAVANSGKALQDAEDRAQSAGPSAAAATPGESTSKERE
jgi:molybdenum cofactor biosynthesis enzyme MoaA